jgi:His/Glu/Gln/Arg/opine family amino acid ABC transporter permease subunit
MTTLSDPHSDQVSSRGRSVVNRADPPIKPPPLLVVGPLAWVRNNLFRTPFDTILTLISIGLIVSLVTGILTWAVTQANWLVVTYNLRQFFVGRYEFDYEWRVQITLLITAFILGFNLAAWARVSRALVLAIGLLLALSFIVPTAAKATIPLPESHLAAGSLEIVSGSSTETPQPQLGFIAPAGEVIAFRLDESLSTDDSALRSLTAYADIASNLLRGEAQNRLDAERRLAELDSLLNDPSVLLTDRQRESLTEEREDLTIPPPVVETYALNQSAVDVRIWRGSTGETIAEGRLEPGSPPLEVTAPEAGWYVVDKTVAVEGAAVLLATRGIYPLLERSFSRSEVLDEAGNVVESGGRFSEYTRLTDNFTLVEPRPRNEEGADVPMATIIDNQFRGESSLPIYLRLYLTPFLELVNVPFLLIVLLTVAGYVSARAQDRFMSPSERPRRASQRSAVWLLAALPLVMFVLVYGVGTLLPITDTRRWGGLLLTIMLTMVGIIASFPLGVLLALGRRSELPVVSAVSTIYIEAVRGVPLITVLFMAQLLVPLINPTLAEVPNVFRAMVGIILFSAAYLAENVRGGLQSVPPGQEEAAKAVGMSGWQIITFITLPQALRAVIPALVGQFISLFKDTSLVAIVGLVDLTGIAESIVAQTEFLGLRREVYIFITLIYFVFSYSMGYISRRIEETGSGAARKF